MTPLPFTLATGFHAAGTQTIGPFTIPAGYTLADISIDGISVADYEKAANKIDAGVFIARDGTHYPPDRDCGATWEGGNNGVDGPQTDGKGRVDHLPIVDDCGIDPSWWGKPAKVVLTISGGFTFGAVVTLT